MTRQSPNRLIDRIKTLRQRYTALDAQVALEQRRPAPDHARLTDLQQQTLGLKAAIRVTKAMLLRTSPQPSYYSQG